MFVKTVLAILWGTLWWLLNRNTSYSVFLVFVIERHLFFWRKISSECALIIFWVNFLFYSLFCCNSHIYKWISKIVWNHLVGRLTISCKVSILWYKMIVNPRRACAARVTVVVLCVCPLSQNSPLERLFVLKLLSRTQRATKVKKYVGISLKPLRCRDTPLPAL